MYTTFTPLLFRDIDVRAIPTRRLTYSRIGLVALTRNAHHVKGIRMDNEFFGHYYECLTTAAALGQLQYCTIGTGAPGMGASTAVNEVFPSDVTAVTALGAVMFPRMINLSRFDYNLPAPGED
jgi:hypothetical protein